MKVLIHIILLFLLSSCGVTTSIKTTTRDTLRIDDPFFHEKLHHKVMKEKM